MHVHGPCCCALPGAAQTCIALASEHASAQTSWTRRKMHTDAGPNPWPAPAGMRDAAAQGPRRVKPSVMARVIADGAM
eukprot:9126708-Pyramimonas_sp.AAC.1